MNLRAYSSDVAFYESYMKFLAGDARDGLPEALRRMADHVPRFAGLSLQEIQAAKPTLNDARAVYAGEHGFADWQTFVEHLAAIAANPDVEPFCAFIHDVEDGHTVQVAAALDRFPDMVNGIPSTAKTPLHSSGNAEVARLLLDRGADPTIETPLPGGTALLHALVWGAVEIADVIAERCKAPGNLRVAAGLGDLDALAALWDVSGKLTPDAGARRGYYRPNYGWYPWQPRNSEQEILDEGLIYAATNGREEAAAYLLERGANVNGEVYGTTALIRAAWKGRHTMIDWLLDHGAAIDARGWLGGHAKGVTALHIAASSGHVAATQRLIDRGADTTLRDDLYDSTPLGWAQFHGFAATAALLGRS